MSILIVVRLPQGLFDHYAAKAVSDEKERPGAIRSAKGFESIQEIFCHVINGTFIEHWTDMSMSDIGIVTEGGDPGMR